MESNYWVKRGLDPVKIQSFYDQKRKLQSDLGGVSGPCYSAAIVSGVHILGVPFPSR